MIKYTYMQSYPSFDNHETNCRRTCHGKGIRTVQTKNEKIKIVVKIS